MLDRRLAELEAAKACTWLRCLGGMLEAATRLLPGFSCCNLLKYL